MPNTQRSILFIVVSILLTLYFLFAAVVQYNDPDPIHWMLLYLTSAIGCMLAAMGKDRPALLYTLVGMAVIEMAMTGDGFLTWLRVGKENLITAKMTAEKPYIELGREFLGALISFAVALWQIRRVRKL
jgi:Transmembrane family 220, helix